MKRRPDPFVALDLWLLARRTSWVETGNLRAGDPERYVEVDRYGYATGREANFNPSRPLWAWRRVASWLIRPMVRREVARWDDVG